MHNLDLRGQCLWSKNSFPRGGPPDLKQIHNETRACGNAKTRNPERQQVCKRQRDADYVVEIGECKVLGKDAL